MNAQPFAWDDIRHFVAVARDGTLSAAARRLGVTHTTVYRRLAALEARIGAPLFDRRGGRYALTPLGEKLLPQATRMEDDALALDRQIAGEDPRPSGTVRLTTPDTIAELLLPGPLASFRTAQPAIAVELVADNRFLNLTRREADVALRPGLRHEGDMVGRRLAGLAGAVYAAPGYPAGDDWRAHDWLAPDPGMGGLAITGWIADNVPEERIALRSNSLMALQHGCRAGMGLAALPCFMGDGDPGLVRVSPVMPAFESALWLLTHRDLRTSARIRVFMDHLVAELTKLRPLLEGRSR